MDVVKRLNYFDHQFLRAPDFNDEQKYHLSMRRLHNSLLHSWGIVQGLTVTVPAGGTGTAVTISAGVAIDSLGREIVLPTATSLELGGVAANAVAFITIAYHEEQSDPTTEAGGQGNTRWTELPTPVFSVTPPSDASVNLILGKVPRTATGLGTVDPSGRKLAGATVSPDLTLNSLTLKNDATAQAAWPKLICTGANQAAVTNGNLTLDAQREIFFADNGQIRSLDNNHKLVFNRGQNLLELYEFGDIRFLTGSGLTEKMRVQASGNVGIGASSPQTRLQVNTLTSIDEGTTAAGAWANFGSNAHFDGNWKRVDATKAGVNLHMNADDGAGQEFRFLRVEANGSNQRNLAVIGSKLTCILESNVGIGTASPGEPLEVNGRIKSSALTVGPWPANPAGYVFVGTNALDQTNAGNYALLQGSGAETGVTFVNSPQRINFRIANVDRMRLLNDGTIQWGNDSQLQADQGGSIELGGNDTTAGTGIPYIDFHFRGLVQDFNTRIINDANGQLTLVAPTLVASGNALKPGGGAWGSVSDVKLKKNVKAMTGVLDKLLKLRGVHYEWRDPAKHANLTGRQMGLVAQEVEEVFPEWVGTDANGHKTVTVRGFEALVIEALRELKAENEALKQKYKALEAKAKDIGREPKAKS